MKNYKTIIAVVAAGLACSAVTSRATLTGISSPGGSVSSVPASTPTFGTLLADTGALGYSFGSGADTGTVETKVYASDTESGALSGYAFVYTVTVTKGDLAIFSPNGFGGLTSIAVGSISGAVPMVMDWDEGNGVVDVIFKDSAGGTPLTTTATVIVDTSATAYSPNLASLSDNAPPGAMSILAPVPEPTTFVAGALMLLPLGIGAVRSLRKERTT